MSALNLSVKHGRTFDDARTRMKAVVAEILQKYGSLVQRVEWADDGNGATLSGVGVEAKIHVDHEHVHVTGDIPILGALFSSPLVSGLKGIVQDVFQKRLS